MKNIKQLFKSINAPLLGEYTPTIVGGKKIDINAVYRVSLFDENGSLIWLPVAGFNGSASGEYVNNYNELSRLLNGYDAIRAEITVEYQHKNKLYLDSQIILEKVDDTWQIKSFEIL